MNISLAFVPFGVVTLGLCGVQLDEMTTEIVIYTARSWLICHNDYYGRHFMKHIIHSSEDLGFALRAVRKSAKVRLDDLSQTARVSKQTTVNFEKGMPTVQFGKVLQLLKEVGLTLSVDLPESALPALRRVQREALERLTGSLGSAPDELSSVNSANIADAED